MVVLVKQGALSDVIRFASEVHGEQRRGGIHDLPYTTHLNAVDRILVHTLGDACTLKQRRVAWLHDSVEDTDVTPEHIAGLFGADVAEGVVWLTNSPGLYGAEKNADQVTKALAMPDDIKAVRLADKTHNALASILDPKVKDDVPLKRLQRLQRGVNVAEACNEGVAAQVYPVFDMAHRLAVAYQWLEMEVASPDDWWLMRSALQEVGRVLEGYQDLSWEYMSGGEEACRQAIMRIARHMAADLGVLQLTVGGTQPCLEPC